MKKITALLLIILIAFTAVSCSSTKDSTATESAEKQTVQKNDYVISADVAKESIIDGVMTDISASDPVLKRTSASWLDTCVLYEVNIRQFTQEGTFAAFENHLNRLKEMGVNTLWLMPIHPISETERKGTLGSYYAVSDYKAVNPEFGTMDDFKHLLNKAHDMGFKVILDWVANHTGWDNAWITEHEDWYVHDKNGKIESPYDWTDTAQLDFDNYEMRAEMIKCMQYWIEDIGVDGFRCDHAIGIPVPFWNAAVYKLKSVNSEIMMLAESSANPNMTKYAFDCCYNDPLYGQATMIQGGIDPSSILSGMEISERYSEGSFPMNYLDNHDKNSYEGSVVDRFGNSYRTALALSFISPGIPLIYTSDEQGYDHEIEFFEKDAVEWDDDPKYADMIAVLSKLKAEHEALSTFNTALDKLTADNDYAFAVKRTSGEDTVLFISNLFYEEIKDVSVDADFEKATCVLRYDGTELHTEPAEMTQADFEHKDYQPYEFYVLTVGE